MEERNSFIDALREKYCDDDAENGGGESFVQIITVFGGGSRRRPRGDSAGEDGGQGSGGHGDENNAPELGYLKSVTLYNSKITHAAIPSTGLSSLCPNVRDLDLAGNILSSWGEVMMILQHLPCLKFVNVSSNPLGKSEIAWNEKIPCTIEDLVLNDTKVAWSEVATLSRLMPKLKQLHLCKNDYDTIDLSDEDAADILCHLHLLALNNNKIKRWDEVTKLRALPQLHSLILLENPLEDVYYKQTHPASPESSDEKKKGHGSENEAGSHGNEVDEEKIQLTKKPDEVSSDLQAGLADEKGDAVAADNQQSSRPSQNSEESNKTGPAEPTDNPTSGTSKPEELVDPAFPALESLCVTGTRLSDWQHLQELRHFPRLHSVKIKNIPLLESWEEGDRRKLAVACLPSIKRLNGSEILPEERERAERHFVRFFMDHERPPSRLEELVQKHGKLQPLHQIDLNQGFKEFMELRFIYKGRCIHQGQIRVVNSVKELRKFCGNLIDTSFRLVKLYHMTQDPDTHQPVMDELFLDSLPLSRFDMKDGDEILIDLKKMLPKIGNQYWEPGIKLAP